ncbi:MAG: rhomboid family intramembrane serine protease [Lachnospiraceae bacterium]|nr:rhomboid family intramembrane serine protease [Lachnospiraceae bacterium]MDD3794744.1 rhomboid family intramembrane serine protease [Lachnospiraceae bacterium]
MGEIKEFIKKSKKMNLLMVAVNVAVFLIFSIMGSTEDGYFMMEHGACYTPAILEGGEYYRLFTGMFLHFGFYHLVYNMICLLFLGDMVESVVGPLKYLVIYLAGGLAGNVLSMVMELRTGDYALSAGASGAIFAVMGSLLYIVIRNKGRLGTVTEKRLLLAMVLIILQGFVDTGTNNAAHIGGCLTGFLLGALLYHKRREKPIDQNGRFSGQL